MRVITDEERERRREYMRAYNKTAAAKGARDKWRDKNAGRVVEYRKEYLARPGVREHRKDQKRLWAKSPSGREHIQRYAEKAKELRKAWDDSPIGRAYRREWGRAHPECKAAWSKRNRGKLNAKVCARQKALRDALASLTPAEREEVASVYRELETAISVHCRWCGRELPKGEREIDHVIPFSRQGKHAMENLAPTCRSCNARKGNLMPDEYAAWLKSEEAAMYESYVGNLIARFHRGETLLNGELELIRGRVALIA
jgi:5-methylcytosine-specific restriction endonuclease McrA